MCEFILKSVRTLGFFEVGVSVLAAYRCERFHHFNRQLIKYILNDRSRAKIDSFVPRHPQHQQQRLDSLVRYLKR